MTVAARAKAEHQAGRRFEEARRLEARGRVSAAWSGVERGDRPYRSVKVEVAERQGR
jgi:hypothetical protein